MFPQMFFRARARYVASEDEPWKTQAGEETQSQVLMTPELQLLESFLYVKFHEQII